MNEERTFFLVAKKILFGIQGDLNDKKIHTVNRIGSNAFLLLLTYMLISNVLILVIEPSKGAETLVSFSLINLFFSLVIILGYVTDAISKSYINTDEIESPSFPQNIIRLRKGAVRVAAYMTIYLIGSQLFLNHYFDHITYKTGIKSLSIYVSSLVLGTIGGLVIYFYWRIKISKK